MYAEILIEIKNKHVDKTFTYHIPDNLVDKIKVGMRVTVPFGKITLEGYVLNLLNSSSIETKDIYNVLDTYPVLNGEMLLLGKFLALKTLSSLSSSYAAMLPKALKAKKGVDIKAKQETYLKITEEIDASLENASSASQKEVLMLFKDNLTVKKTMANKISASAVKTLLKKGVLIEYISEVYRYNLKNESEYTEKVLNEEQTNAVNTICDNLGNSKTILLHGVTGSGKTEVYIKTIERVLNEDKTALVLVPEISLTPQFVDRFNKAFPSKIAVLHSGLSEPEKYDEWRKITRGEVSIVIGARSAIFAPLKNIGIIIMDEEQSLSYKQENNPKYHALWIAKERSKYHNAPLVLGSATPSLSSMARALKGVYIYIKINARFNKQALPNITLVDMVEEQKNKHPVISRELECAIIERLNKKEQIMLLLNRRGHSTTITCSNCGFTYRCPHCDITLTYHKSSNNMRCHYCGYTKYLDNTCPKCHETSLNYYGLGTEKLEEYIKDAFPTAKVIRMDADSVSNKGSHAKVTEAFASGKYDILLGTQMISKGLDFPNVTLVGIINADASLNIPDYQSNERTFELLCQASGRSGRGEKNGEVFIQTYNPETPIFTFVKNHDYKNFFLYEMNIRKTLKYPPYYYLCFLKVKSKDYKQAIDEARKIKAFLDKNLTQDYIVLGPATANMFLVNGVYNFEIYIKYKKEEKLYQVLKELDKLMLVNSKVQLDIDFLE